MDAAVRTSLFIVLLGVAAAATDARAGLARDRLSQAGAEQFAARAMETSRVRFTCTAMAHAEEVFFILGRPYDIGLAMRMASGDVRAVQCVATPKPVRQDGQRYRPRLVPVDPAGHRLLYAWSCSPTEGLNRLASDQFAENP